MRIGTAWKNLQKEMKEGQGDNQKGFVATRQELDRINMSMGAVNAAMTSFAKVVREELTNTISKTAEMSGVLDKVGGGLLKLSGLAEGAGARLALAGGGIAAFATVATGALFKVTQSYAEAELAAIRFRDQLGGATDAQVRQWRRIGEAIGMTREEADGLHLKVNELVQELSRGEYSPLYQSIAKHEGGEALARQLVEMRQAGASIEEINKKFVEGVAHWNNLAAKHELPVYELPKQQLKELNDSTEALIHKTHELEETWENATQKMSDNMKLKLFPQLTNFMDMLL